MSKIKSAMPSHQNGKRILFPSSENFGKGSYDPYRGLHKGYLQDGKILVTVLRDEEIDDTVSYNSFPLNIYEN